MMKRLALIAGGVLAASGAHAVVVTASNDGTDLATALIGTGITLVGTPSYIGTATQSGTFTDGGAAVGFDSGVVLTSGNVNDVPGPNDNGPETRGGGGTGDDDISTSLGTTGDADLNGLLPSGQSTNDAAVLEFDFQFGDGTVGGDLFFNFVFASEEYIDWIDTSFNDVFGFFVDGVNVALVPGTTDPITINTVNDVENSAFYRNNVANPDGITNLGLDISFDGLTTVITAQALGLGAGAHTMKFAVADTSDGLLDAGVFLQGGSFSNEPPDDDDDPQAVPEPGSLALLGAGLIALGFARRKQGGSV